MSTTIHVVRRLFGWTGPVERSRGLERAFLREADARTWVATQEEKERLRRDVNPFTFSPELSDCTTMPPEVLHDWLLDHDFPAHDLNGPLGWEDWWQAYSGNFTAEQHADLWCVLDRVCFFQLCFVEWRGRRTHIPKAVYVHLRPQPRDERGRFVDVLSFAADAADPSRGFVANAPVSVPIPLA